MSRRVSSPVLVGRRDELDALVAAFDRARGGAGGLVLVEGEAGIGKSRLIDEFVTHAELEGGCVLLGSCLPFADVVPFAPVAQILASLRAAAPDVPPPDVADTRDRARWLQWVVDRLTVLGSATPVVVVVEDLHWADESTGDLLLFVANAARTAPLMVLGSRRPDEQAHGRRLAGALGELLRSGRAERLGLTPLADGELTALIGEILGIEPSRALRDRVVARADGNPFFAEELVAAGGGTDLPTTVGDVILQRVDRVGADARQLLRVAAVIGRRVGHRLLREVSGTDGPTMDRALRDAVSHQLLVASHDRYEFRHALGHEAVYGDLLPGERIELHERVAVALAAHPELALGDDAALAAAELAHHWFAADRLPETLAASVTAGRAAEAAHAPVEAQFHFGRALELWPDVEDAATTAGTDGAWLLDHAAAAAFLAGDHRRAAELADELLTVIDADREPQRHARILDRRALYLWYEGDIARSRVVTEQLRTGDPDVTTPAAVTRLSGVAHQLALQLHYLEALGAARQALDAARRLDNRVELAFVLHVLGSLEGHLGRHEEAIARLDESLTISLDGRDAPRIGATWHNLIEAEIFAGHPAAAHESASRALPELQHYGLARTYVALATGQLTFALLALGRWDEADAAGGALLADDVDRYFTLPVCFGRLHLLVRRGRFDAVERLLSELAITFPYNPYVTGVCAGWDAEMALWQGDWTAARTALGRGTAITASSDEILLDLRLAALGARLEADELSWSRLNAVAVDPSARRAAARDHVRRAESFLERVEASVGCCSLPFRRLLGLARAELTRLDDRPPAAPWAAIAADSAADTYLAAYARWREAEALLATPDHGSRDRALAALRDACVAADRLAARPLLAAVVDLAGRARIELGAPYPPGAQERAAPADDGLSGLDGFGFTKRELEVLRLLARGLSNREIGEALYISAKTASVHVTHIFQKLNVTTRVQAAVVAQRFAG